MKLFLQLLVLALVSFSSAAYEVAAYKKPIPFYNYVTDIEPLLNTAVTKYHWALSKDKQGKFFANLSYKDYAIKIALVTEQQQVRIELLSTARPGCTSWCSIDKEDVEGWLLRLRKSIALEVTFAARKAAQKEYLLAD